MGHCADVNASIELPAMLESVRTVRDGMSMAEEDTWSSKLI